MGFGESRLEGGEAQIDEDLMGDGAGLCSQALVRGGPSWYRVCPEVAGSLIEVFSFSKR